jgi:uncharacterized protein (DUF305 family)
MISARRMVPARRGLVLAVSAAGVALTVAACGSGSSNSGMTASSQPAAASSAAAVSASPAPVTPGPAAQGAHNAADVAFATDMISHHGQAVQMSDMLMTRGSDPTVKALAEKIKAAQAPQIATMSGWLKGWGQTVPDPYATMADQMGGMGMKGIMTEAQMHRLDIAKGTAADQVFLTLMPEHHQGAIDMAKTEVKGGANADAKKLAQAIISAQTTEIAQMKTILAGLPSS